MVAWNNVPAGILRRAEQELLGAYGDYADRILGRMVSDPAFPKRQALRTLIDAVPYPSGPMAEAQQIMGENFFGPIEISMLYGMVRTSDSHMRMPFSPEKLERYRHTHILAAIPDISLDGLVKGVGKGLLHIGEATGYTGFLGQPTGGGWHLIAKQPREAHAQSSPLGATALVCALINHYIRTGERLFDGARIYTNQQLGSRGLNLWWRSDTADHKLRLGLGVRAPKTGPHSDLYADEVPASTLS